MVNNYPYLNDLTFLDKIYKQHNRSIYTKITVLDWDERPIQEVQGRTISASISENGDSSVRRTANLSVKIFNDDELYSNIDSLFSINKKIFIELGLNNGFAHLGANYYSDYPIVWFPFGVMIISNYSINHDTSGVTISLSLNDKMSLLNGDAGGTIPASTNFESVIDIGTDGDYHTEYRPINEIIPEMVHHFGGEDLNKIIVNDIPSKIKQVMKWIGTNPLYFYLNKNNTQQAFYSSALFNDNQLGAFGKWKIIHGYDAGYSYVDFTYPGELVANAGDTVCSVLDQIKDTLGNYEYYYDIFGNFIFQEIKNYVNTTEWRTIYNDITSNTSNASMPYAYNTRLNSKAFPLTTDMIISCNNTPQYNMIKNDYIVWGTRETASGIKIPIRYHLAIDDKPSTTEPLTVDFPVCFDTDLYDKIKRCHWLETEKGPWRTLAELERTYPVGMVGKYYKVGGTFGNEEYEVAVYTWTTDVAGYKEMLNNYVTQKGDTEVVSLTDISSVDSGAGYVKLPYATYYDNFTVTGGDWRNRLYFQGLMAAKKGTQNNYYYQELCNEWGKLYDMEANEFLPETKDNQVGIDYWLDFIDDAAVSEFSVSNIGRRSYTKTENGCNCIFEPDIPNCVMVNTASEDVVDTRSQYTKAQLRELGLLPVQVDPAIYDSLTLGGSFNSCYEAVRQVLTDYTDYNNSISLTCLPIYHLEPNTRIYIDNPTAGVQGDYLINSISFDLGNGGSMSISAKKIVEKM